MPVQKKTGPGVGAGYAGRVRRPGSPARQRSATASEPGFILSLDKALAILRCFEEGGQLGVTDVARRLSLHLTIVSRMLATLRRHGIVQQLGDRGKCILGITPIVLANAALAEMPMRRQVLPLLQRVSDTYNVATNLGILHEGIVLYLANISRDPRRRMHAIAGNCAPVYATGLGKARAHAAGRRVHAEAALRGQGQDGLRPNPLDVGLVHRRQRHTLRP